MKDIEALKAKIIEANDAYRTGKAIMSDSAYDELLEELNELTEGSDELLDQIGFEVSSDDSRKENLPIPMYSMNKIKTVEELQKWAKLKEIPEETLMVVTPKFDGLSLCAEENLGDAWTRGNGIQGQRSNSHYAKIISNKKAISEKLNGFTFGEVIMKKSTFERVWAEKFRNSRNMGAGALNRKEAEDMLKDFEFMRFGLAQKEEETLDKLQQIEILNRAANQIPLDFKTIKLNEIDEAFLQKTFAEFGNDFEIDGLIVEINDKDLRMELGRERSGNPVYARAWKGFSETQKTSTIRNIRYQVSKHGLLKPVAEIDPIELDGVTVSNVTLINGKYIKESELGIGAKVGVIRSGQVIPKIVEIIETVEVDLPKNCPSCNNEIKWNENGVEIFCDNHQACKAQILQKNIAFFEILEVENFASGIIEQLYDNGYDSIAKILKMSQGDFEALDSFKEKKATKIHQAIQEKIKEIPLHKLQHATSIFEGLGSKKLLLLNQFDDSSKKPSLEEIVAIDGFSEKSAQIYLNSFDAFWDFVKDLPITIAKPEIKELNSEKLIEYAVCFSGVRNKELQKIIEDNGGKIASGVSKKTSHLVMKEIGSGSSKEQKAEKLEIPIFTLEDFEKHVSEVLGDSNSEKQNEVLTLFN